MRKLYLDLQRFAEGAAAAGDMGEGTGDAGQTVDQTGTEELFESGEETIEEEPEDEPEEESFKDLIKGKYKNDFKSEVEGIVKGRVRNYQENLEKTQKVLDLIAKKYGVDATNVEDVEKAILDDDSYYESEAAERGMDVETLKHIKKLERENEQFAADVKKREEQSQQQEAWNEILSQAEEVKELYPDFDLEQEMQNEQFGMLVAANVPVQTAYEAIHMSEIQPRAMKAVADKTAERVAKSVAANKKRPQEGGRVSQPTRVKKSVDSLSYDDIDEINRRVLAGEKVNF